MNIGKAAHLSGLSVKTVRYYSDLGIIKPDVNPNTGYRNFSQSDLEKLKFLGKARNFGFGLKECRELLLLYGDKSRSSKEVKALTLDKISEIDNKLAELNKLKQQLIHLAETCQGDENPDCPIINALANKPT